MKASKNADEHIKELVESKKLIAYCQFPPKECPSCDTVKNLLKINNIDFEAVNINTPESLTELAMNYCFPMYTPILQKGNEIFYRQLWKIHGKELDIDAIKKLIYPNKKDWIDVGGHICENGVCRI